MHNADITYLADPPPQLLLILLWCRGAGVHMQHPAFAWHVQCQGFQGTAEVEHSDWSTRGVTRADSVTCPLVTKNGSQYYLPVILTAKSPACWASIEGSVMLRPVARLLKGPGSSRAGCLVKLCETNSRGLAKVATRADVMRPSAMVFDRASSSALQRLLERSRYYASHCQVGGLSNSEVEEICQLAGANGTMSAWGVKHGHVHSCMAMCTQLQGINWWADSGATRVD